MKFLNRAFVNLLWIYSLNKLTIILNNYSFISKKRAIPKRISQPSNLPKVSNLISIGEMIATSFAIISLPILDVDTSYIAISMGIEKQLLKLIQ